MEEILGGLGHKIACIQSGDCYDNLMRTVTTDFLAMAKTRIHEQGRASDTSRIGTYSTKEMWASQSSFVGSGFKAQGKIRTGTKTVKAGTQTTKVSQKFTNKKGETKVRTVNVAIKSNFTERKSMYLEKGYKEFRQVQGRESGFVNLSLSGQLNNQLTITTNGKKYEIGWPNKEMKERAVHLEKKYGKKIWSPSDEEKELILKSASDFLKNAFSKTAN